MTGGPSSASTGPAATASVYRGLPIWKRSPCRSNGRIFPNRLAICFRPFAGRRAKNWCCRTMFLSNKFSPDRSEEHTSELQSLMRISYAVFCLKKQTEKENTTKRKYNLENE